MPSDEHLPEDDEPRRPRKAKPWDKRESDELDEEDEEPRPRRRRRREPDSFDDPALPYLVPINTSVLAIAAGYLGLISVLCFPAPIALLLGIMALVSLKKNPKLHGRGRAIFAIVMGGLGTIGLIMTLIALAAGMR